MKNYFCFFFGCREYEISSSKAKEGKKKNKKKITFSNSFAKKIDKNMDFFILEELTRQKNLLNTLCEDAAVPFDENRLAILKKDSIDSCKFLPFFKGCNLDDLVVQNDELDDIIKLYNEEINSRKKNMDLFHQELKKIDMDNFLIWNIANEEKNEKKVGKLLIEDEALAL